MGKSNRIKTKKATNAISFESRNVKGKKKNGVPNWAVNLITIAVALVILVAVALSLMSANGVFTRWQTAAESANFRVNGNMMKYYFQSTYSEYLEQNGSYLTYYGFDSNLPLKAQPLDSNDPTQGTWYDYMVTMTKSEVTRMLVYCEEAEARGIELNDEDKESLKEQLEMLDIYAEMYGYPSTNSYVSVIYGEGMKLKDVRKAMELSALASKCAAEISEEIEASITDDMINDEYNAHNLEYDLADYMHYTFSVSYKDAVDAVCGEDADDATKDAKAAEILVKYKEMIADARAKAAALKGKTDAFDFKNEILKDIASDVYDKSFETTDDDSDITTEKMPSEENLATIKTKLSEHIVDLMLNGKTYEKITTEENGTYKVFGIEITKEFAEFVDDLAPIYMSDMEYNLNLYVAEKTAYKEDDDAIKWIFGEGRKAGDVTTFEDGDNANGDEFAANADDLSKFEITVYLVNKAQYKNDELTKNIGVIAFSSEDAAKAAIEKLSAGMSLDDFKALAGETATFTNFEDYAEGDSGVSGFDKWAFADGIAVGAVTTEPIYLAESTYGIALYHGNGHAAWYVTVRNSLYSEKIEDIGEEITAKYTVTFNDKAINKIDA